jgi:hypothetical protein
MGPMVLILLFVGFTGKQHAAAEARRNKNG